MADRARSLRLSTPEPNARWRLDLAAAILFLIGLLASLCVFSHDPADPPSVLVYPPNARPSISRAPRVAESKDRRDSLGLLKLAIDPGDKLFTRSVESHQ